MAASNLYLTSTRENWTKMFWEKCGQIGKLRIEKHGIKVLKNSFEGSLDKSS